MARNSTTAVRANFAGAVPHPSPPDEELHSGDDWFCPV